MGAAGDGTTTARRTSAAAKCSTGRVRAAASIVTVGVTLRASTRCAYVCRCSATGRGWSRPHGGAADNAANATTGDAAHASQLPCLRRELCRTDCGQRCSLRRLRGRRQLLMMFVIRKVYYLGANAGVRGRSGPRALLEPRPPHLDTRVHPNGNAVRGPTRTRDRMGAHILIRILIRKNNPALQWFAHREIRKTENEIQSPGFSTLEVG